MPRSESAHLRGRQFPIGERFGRLVVDGLPELRPRSDGRNRAHISLRCDCGGHVWVAAYNLMSKDIQSCGCLRRVAVSFRFTTHARSGSKLHGTWKNMKSRCTNPNNPNYRWYGGKGVQVDPEWDDFVNFVAWAEAAGYEPGLEIDRIDASGNYCAENCRWATKRDNVKHARLIPLALDERLEGYARLHGKGRADVIEMALEAFLPQLE